MQKLKRKEYQDKEIDVEKICSSILKLRHRERQIKGKNYKIEDIARLSMEGEMSKWEYTNPVLIILDAVLAINRNYLTFVKPRILKFKEEYKDIKEIDKMLELINNMGDEKFCNNVLKYNDKQRLELLKKVLETFKDYKEKNNMKNDYEAMKHWAMNFNMKKLGDDEIYKIKGIGLSTIQYLRMLLGVNTMMPDRHIKSWILEELGLKSIGEKKYIRLLEDASKELNISCRMIAEYIWALKNPKIPALEED